MKKKSIRKAKMDYSPIIDLVRSTMVKYLEAVSQKHGMKIDDFPEPPVIEVAYCQVLLKSGRNQGNPCGKKCTKGRSMCTTHFKKHENTEDTEAPSSSSPGKGGPSLRAVLNKSKFGNYVINNMVVDRLTKCIVGTEGADGSIIPLTPADKVKAALTGLKIQEEEEKKEVVDVEKASIVLEEVADEAPQEAPQVEEQVAPQEAPQEEDVTEEIQLN